MLLEKKDSSTALVLKNNLATAEFYQTAIAYTNDPGNSNNPTMDYGVTVGCMDFSLLVSAPWSATKGAVLCDASGYYRSNSL